MTSVSLTGIHVPRADNRFDVLRLLAALLVLWSHCFPLGARPHQEPLASTLGLDTLGGVGVAIFFVLSGYLVTQSLERSSSIWVFFRRRAVRIYPAVLVVTLLSLAVLGPALTRLDLREYVGHRMTWDYLNNALAFTVRYPLPGVFEANPAPHAVNGSLWSLPYEVKCYLVLAAGSLLLPARIPLRYKALAALLFLVTVALLRPSVPPAPFTDLFWGLDHYHSKLGILFALGAVFATWREHFSVRWWLPVLLALGVASLPAGKLQAVAFWLMLGTLALWLALQASWLPRIPSRMGDWSYGAYLYGFPVQQTLAHFGLHTDSFALYLVACTLVTLALAALSWHGVEKPALRWK